MSESKQLRICTNAWECVADIKRRTGIRAEHIHPVIRDELARKVIECKLEGDDTLMIPYFRIRSTQG